MIFKDIHNPDVFPNEYLDFVEAKTKEVALPSSRTYSNKIFLNNEFIALQDLSKNTNLVIQKSGKGNSVVIVERQDNFKKWISYVIKINLP